MIFSEVNQIVYFLEALGVPTEKIKKVLGINFDIETQKVKRETVVLVEFFKRNNFSLNVGGNYNLALGTVGYELEKLPFEIHLGITKKINGFFNFKKGYGVFAGFSFEF